MFVSFGTGREQKTKASSRGDASVMFTKGSMDLGNDYYYGGYRVKSTRRAKVKSCFDGANYFLARTTDEHFDLLRAAVSRAAAVACCLCGKPLSEEASRLAFVEPDVTLSRADTRRLQLAKSPFEFASTRYVQMQASIGAIAVLDVTRTTPSTPAFLQSHRKSTVRTHFYGSAI